LKANSEFLNEAPRVPRRTGQGFQRERIMRLIVDLLHELLGIVRDSGIFKEPTRLLAHDGSEDAAYFGMNKNERGGQPNNSISDVGTFEQRGILDGCDDKWPQPATI
jgi:hypothetical protein